MPINQTQANKKCICNLNEAVADIQNQIDNLVDNDNQQLTISGDTISLTNGGSVTVTHPTSSVTPTICNGTYVYTSPRRGRVGTTVDHTDNSTVTVLDWFSLGTFTAPSCVTDMNVITDFGDVYCRMESTGVLSWADVRYVINGVPLANWVTDRYNYVANRNNTALDVNMQAMGTSLYSRFAVAAGATISVEIRLRNRRWGAQTGARLLSYGLWRPKFQVTAIPRQIVTNVT